VFTRITSTFTDLLCRDQHFATVASSSCDFSFNLIQVIVVASCAVQRFWAMSLVDSFHFFYSGTRFWTDEFSHFCCNSIPRGSKKTGHLLLPITSPNVDRFFHPQTHSAVNLYWNSHQRSNHTSNVSLHYLVKCKCHETIDNLK